MNTRPDFPYLSAGRRPLRNFAALIFGLMLASLKGLAGVTLLVNGGTSAVVNAGDPITFSWQATPDTWRLERGWGTSQGTELPLVGSESIRAGNTAVATTQSFFASATAHDGTGSSASVEVTVLPAASVPQQTPIVWTPSLGFFPLSTLSFYIVPDALIGVPYAAALSATGREPITYAAVSLPDGLSIVGNSIVGVPTTNAWVQGGNFTLTATDADGYTSATLARMMTPVLYPRTLTPVQAPVVFDGGAPNPDGAYVNDPSAGLERAGSGFVLKSATTVTGVRVWGTYLARFRAETDSFTIRFLDHGTSPLSIWPSYPEAGRLIGTFTPTTVTRSKTGRAVLGAPDAEYVYDLTFPGIALEADHLYYLSVENNTVGEQWGWLPSMIQNYPSWGAYSQDGGATFPGGSFELAFQLREGAPVVPPPPVAPKTYKLIVKSSGKGTVTSNPTGASSGASYPAGTVVTLTASPDPKDSRSVWKGWTGDVVSQNRTITVTLNGPVTVQANFR